MSQFDLNVKCEQAFSSPLQTLDIIPFIMPSLSIALMHWLIFSSPDFKLDEIKKLHYFSWLLWFNRTTYLSFDPMLKFCSAMPCGFESVDKLRLASAYYIHKLYMTAVEITSYVRVMITLCGGSRYACHLALECLAIIVRNWYCCS